MSPTVFGYVVLFTLLLAGAAAAVEWGTQGRIATRHLWTAAIVLALPAPPVVLAWHAAAQRSATAGSNSNSASDEVTMIVMNSARAGVRNTSALVSRDAPIRSIFPNRHAAMAALSRLSQRVASVAITVWALLSLALIAWLAAGVFHWHRVQRAWRRTTSDGVDVCRGTLDCGGVLRGYGARLNSIATPACCVGFLAPKNTDTSFLRLPPGRVTLGVSRYQWSGCCGRRRSWSCGCAR